MKKTVLMIAAVLAGASLFAQGANQDPFKAAVLKLDQANNTRAYQQLAGEFLNIAETQKKSWLPYYYAALCNAKIGWLKQDDPDNIEPFADKADEQIRMAKSLLDTNTQKKELSEVYSVFGMINRARVFINPMTYGREYGPAASRYVTLARQANPDNPRALYLAGWEKFSTPKMWGGDKDKAKQLLSAARRKFDGNAPAGIEPHWGKKDVDVLLNQLN